VPWFLSDEWVESLDAVLSRDDEFARRATGASIVVQYVVDDAADGGPTRTYHIAIGEGRVHARPGAAPDPTVVFTADRPTATAIATGRERAQLAFMAGRLRLGGEVSVLLDHRGLLTRLGDVTRGVRDRTAFPA
jgi:putative sterol carrier protein